jgi:hypothetical protein
MAAVQPHRLLRLYQIWHGIAQSGFHGLLACWMIFHILPLSLIKIIRFETYKGFLRELSQSVLTKYKQKCAYSITEVIDILQK